jgi:hypothetical protein
MLKKLAAYERQNQLDLALQELGRIERTFFMLDWLESPGLRRRCHAGLNKALRANEDETSAPRKFKLEGVGNLFRGHAQQDAPASR